MKFNQSGDQMQMTFNISHVRKLRKKSTKILCQAWLHKKEVSRQYHVCKITQKNTKISF